MSEPKIHSHIEDGLLADHPLAHQDVYCSQEGCREMLHAWNNECMQTWVETGIGNFCIKHFYEYHANPVMPNYYALPERELEKS